MLGYCLRCQLNDNCRKCSYADTTVSQRVKDDKTTIVLLNTIFWSWQTILWPLDSVFFCFTVQIRTIGRFNRLLLLECASVSNTRWVNTIYDNLQINCSSPKQIDATVVWWSLVKKNNYIYEMIQHRLCVQMNQINHCTFFVDVTFSSWCVTFLNT